MAATSFNLPSLEFGEYWQGKLSSSLPAGTDYSTFTHGKLQIRSSETLASTLLLEASTTAGSGNGYLTLTLTGSPTTGQSLVATWAVPSSVTILLNTTAITLTAGWYEFEISDGTNVIPLYRGGIPFVKPISS